MQSRLTYLGELIAGGGSAQALTHAMFLLVSEMLNSSEVFQARQHPLGFFWVPLTQRAAERTLRLHLWPEKPTIQNPEFLIHDHVFSFRSFVLQGEVRNDEYEIVKSETGEKQLFRVEYNETGSVLVPSGVRVECQLVHSKTCTAGEFYSLPASVYHSTLVPNSNLAATLVLTAAAPAKSAHVIGPITATKRYTCERQQLESTQVAQHLERLLSGLREQDERDGGMRTV